MSLASNAFNHVDVRNGDFLKDDDHADDDDDDMVFVTSLLK